MNQWIATKDKRPERGQQILIWDADWRDVFVSHYDQDSSGWSHGRYTHWQPINPPDDIHGSET